MSEQILLELKGISKSFPGVRALDDISFQIKKGHIHALVGENGAGKSTLIKILDGIYRPDAGAMVYMGRQLSPRSPLDAQKQGISVVHQEIKLVDTLSVAENIFLGRPKTKHYLIDWRSIYKDAQDLLNSLDANLSAYAIVKELSIAQKQIVEICKAMSFNLELLIMDEPSATLTTKEQEVLFRTMRTLKAKGVTIIYISHRLEEIFNLADEVTVLRDGRLVGTSDVKNINRKQLISMMVGRDLENEYPKEKVEIGETLLEVKNLCRGRMVKNISFQLHSGEILGVAGLVGSGRTETARAIFGADKREKGSVIINGKELKGQSVAESIKNKIALVPEDRRRQGLILNMSVKENISLVGIDLVIKSKKINKALEKKMAHGFISKLRIQTPDEEREVKNLSGGNQQKVVLSKWLAVDSDVVIFDEPTRGIDVGAKAEIYRLLCSLAKEGKGIIMISSELPELLGMADRIIVMHDGKISGEVSGKDATQESILELAISR
ncbi:MAG: sugar ABC transporter ATP-binding protein [Spirochaetaceae bacterium]|nr:sugar ABC transporter ATP-binding protein [Spirochaetaceae bacterium]